MTVNGANLPDELIWEILSRLPAKSLGRFKCVSKPWRTLISDPKFIKHQLTQTNRHRESVIFSRVFQPLVVVDFEGDPFDKGPITSVLEFDQPNGWLAVCGSCHGLVLALTVKDELYLINPTFKESKKLSFPGPSGVCRSGILGFGGKLVVYNVKEKTSTDIECHGLSVKRGFQENFCCQPCLT